MHLNSNNAYSLKKELNCLRPGAVKLVLNDQTISTFSFVNHNTFSGNNSTLLLWRKAKLQNLTNEHIYAPVKLYLEKREVSKLRVNTKNNL